MNAGWLNINWHWSLPAAVAAGLLAVGITIWWIIRKRLRDFHLPILRVFEFPSSRLPRVVLRKPPMIPFLMFALAAAAVGVWTLRPSFKVYSNFDHDVSVIHVFVDMSPSISSQVTLSKLAEEVSGIIGHLGPKAKVTLGTSHGQDIFEVTSPSTAGDLVNGLRFHRYGAKIGNSVRAQVGKVGEVDQLIIVSDRDQHSWSGFQWQYFLIDADILFKDLDDSSQRVARPNIFIQDAKFSGGGDSMKINWDVTIAEGALAMPAEGTLSATIAGAVMATESWVIDPARKSTNVNISWPSAKSPEGAGADSIVWTLEVTGGDRMQIDNQFRTPVFGRRDRIAIIGEPSGELKLDDPLTPLESALGAAGYSVARFEALPEADVPGLFAMTGHPKIPMIRAGLNEEISHWCPLASRGQDGGRVVGKIMVMPSADAASYSSVCHCVNRVFSGSSEFSCESARSRDDLIELLRAGGWFQVGGNLGEARGAIAWQSPNKGPLEVLALTVPLAPDSAGGIGWGDFPFLIRDLLRYTTRESSAGVPLADTGVWPRFTDGFLQSLPDNELSRKTLRESNVPVGESLLVAMPVDSLPPLYGATAAVRSGRGPNKRDSEDPQLWIYAVVALVIVASFVEIFWARSRGRRSSLSTVLLAGALMFAGQGADAQTEIDMISDRDNGSATFQKLAREVAARTSIELSPKPSFSGGNEIVAANKAWVWVGSSAAISKDGVLTEKFRRWIKKGGFLVLEGAYNDQALDRLTRDFGSAQKSAGQWSVVAPDHELMRSFYLLSTLPGCRGQSWRVFTFDGRGAIIAIPYSMSGQLRDLPPRILCELQADMEGQIRTFVNILMIAMTTDYKKDQIHLPEILKRLRVP